MQEKRRDGRKQRSGQISGVQVMFATILSVGLILAINFSSRISEGQPIQEAYHRVLDEIEQPVSYTRNLETRRTGFPAIPRAGRSR